MECWCGASRRLGRAKHSCSHRQHRSRHSRTLPGSQTVPPSILRCAGWMFHLSRSTSSNPIKRIYNWASPIDSSEPPDSTVNLASGQTQTFGVQLPQPLNHSLDVTWKVNGNTARTSEQFTFSASTVGSHTVEVFVSDPTVLVGLCQAVQCS